MTLRLAKASDLPELRTMYRKVIDEMYKINLMFWNDVYPYEVLVEDFEAEKLYVMTDDSEKIAAAFAINDKNDGESHVTWSDPDKKAVYLDRLGVNPEYSRQGIGGLAVKYSLQIAKEKGASYLRLFIVDTNKPAENLYLKYGFQQVSGEYSGCVDGKTILTEYGFEKMI